MTSIFVNNQVRCLATHWNPKFRKLRALKVVKPKLPDFDQMRQEDPLGESIQERRKRMIKEGMEPPVSFEYKPVNITSSTEIFDSYVPPEGDGKMSIFSNPKEFGSQALESIKNTAQKMITHTRVVKKHDSSFDSKTFPEFARDIYCSAHENLANRENEKLLEYVTENAYSKMWTNMKYKTIRWKWIEGIEEPKVVNIVTREMMSKSNIFAQVTVRFHSKQILAIYDRFGRLAFGSDKLERNILEYVVFERHLTGQYSSWRMHDKIEPEWLTTASVSETQNNAKTPVIRTFVQPKLFKIHDDSELKTASGEVPKPKQLTEFKKEDAHLEKYSS